MTKPAAHKKHTTGRLQLASILRQTARAVVYLVSALAVVAVVSSCAASVKTHTLDCTPKPLPKECRDAL